MAVSNSLKYDILRQTLFATAKHDALTNMLESAKIQSTEASNKIEGIVTTSERLKQFVREKTMPETRSEKKLLVIVTFYLLFMKATIIFRQSPR